MSYPANTDQDEDEEVNEDSCPICFDNPIITPVTTDGCTHEMCLECIREWSKESKTCPKCRAPFKRFRAENCVKCNKEAKFLSTVDSCKHAFCHWCLFNLPDNVCPKCNCIFKTKTSPLKEGTCCLCWNKITKTSFLLGCEHTFCFPCIEDHRVKLQTCPICESKIRGIVTNAKGDKCSICLGTIKDGNRGATDGCDHYSCYSCLKEWSDFSMSCCTCEKEFTKVIKIITDNSEKAELMSSELTVKETKDWRWSHININNILKKYRAFRIY